MATFLGNLGSVCQKTNRLGEAETYMTRSVQILEAHFGKNHPRLAAAWNNLGLLYWQMGRSDQAAPIFQRCLDLLERQEEKNPSALVPALGNLAAINQALGRKEQAWQLQERALQIQHTGLGHVFLSASHRIGLLRRPILWLYRFCHTTAGNLSTVVSSKISGLKVLIPLLMIPILFSTAACATAQ